MMKEVLHGMETGLIAQIGLIAFMVAFTLIILRVLMLKPSERTRSKNLPLNDPPAWTE